MFLFNSYTNFSNVIPINYAEAWHNGRTWLILVNHQNILSFHSVLFSNPNMTERTLHTYEEDCTETQYFKHNPHQTITLLQHNTILSAEWTAWSWLLTAGKRSQANHFRAPGATDRLQSDSAILHHYHNTDRVCREVTYYSLIFSHQQTLSSLGLLKAIVSLSM